MTAVQIKKLSIIIPTYNEQMTISDLMEYVRSVPYPIDYEIIVVDDASVDRTYEKSRDIRLGGTKDGEKIRLFRNEVNRGKGYSVRRGIQHATGDIIIVQDADREYDPHEIPKLIEPILQGSEEVVYGSRFSENTWPEGMAFPNWLANRGLTLLTNILFGLKLTDMETCYKAFRADIVKKLPLKANRFDFEPEVSALLARSGISIKELPIRYQGRSSKEGKKIKARDFFKAVFVLFWKRIF